MLCMCLCVRASLSDSTHRCDTTYIRRTNDSLACESLHRSCVGIPAEDFPCAFVGALEPLCDQRSCWGAGGRGGGREMRARLRREARPWNRDTGPMRLIAAALAWTQGSFPGCCLRTAKAERGLVAEWQTGSGVLLCLAVRKISPGLGSLRTRD